MWHWPVFIGSHNSHQYGNVITIANGQHYWPLTSLSKLQSTVNGNQITFVLLHDNYNDLFTPMGSLLEYIQWDALLSLTSHVCMQLASLNSPWSSYSGSLCRQIYHLIILSHPAPIPKSWHHHLPTTAPIWQLVPKKHVFGRPLLLLLLFKAHHYRTDACFVAPIFTGQCRTHSEQCAAMCSHISGNIAAVWSLCLIAIN